MKATLRRELQGPLSEQIRTTLALRAERLAAGEARTSAETENLLWHAEFRVGNELYALPLDVMRACIPLRAVAAVPLAPADVVGVLRFEGQTVTVFSLASLLAGRGWARDPSVLLIVEPTPGQMIAVDCEQIPVPIGLPHARLSTARARSSEAIIPVTLEGARQVQVIDLRRLLEKRKEARREH